MTTSEAFQIALQHHRSGRLAEAESLYRQILAVQPNHSEARRLLGMLAVQTGRLDLAANPANWRYHLDLGNGLFAQGQLDEAIAAFRGALGINPNCVEAHYNLGNALQNQGQLDEAIAAYRAALQFKPDLAMAHNNLGVALKVKGRLDEAIAAYHRALQIQPDSVDALNNLGVALREMGRFDESIDACQRAIRSKPDQAGAWYNFGLALQSKGRLEECIGAYRRALQIAPNYVKAHNNLGTALKDHGWLHEAVASCRKALQIRPDYPEAWINLGAALAELGQRDEAIEVYRRALEMNPNLPEAHNNLANALKDLGELNGAFAAYRRALEIKPDDAPAHSNLIFALHFDPGQDARTIAEEHARWNRQFSEPIKQFIPPRANNRDPERRLRVGYVSADFWDHPVGRFVLPLFERHDRERIEILCYSGSARSDGMTERLRALAGEWRSTIGVADAQSAEMIREDRVDILVDLALHTAGNRLPVFARQPAPVQVAWLGYPGSTGLPAIGYRLTDGWVEPVGGEAAWSAEERVRLPDCWCCYRPAGEYPEINALPALASGGVTFGSLNKFAKINEGVLALWARVLESVKGSRLVMRCPEGRTRERVRAFFGARGIAQERVELVGFLSRWEHLRLYQRIDIGLDPFPYNGTTTTCDALWMGAPVLTLTGKMPASRTGLSLLSSVALGELAASSEEGYAQVAAELAGDLPRLAELRATLRARMQASPLMDAPRFARNVEAAYRRMWLEWCDKEQALRE